MAGGAWWRCRDCSAYNRKHIAVCGWCKSAKKVLYQLPSTPENPTHSVDCIPPKAKGSGKGKQTVQQPQLQQQQQQQPQQVAAPSPKQAAKPNTLPPGQAPKKSGGSSTPGAKHRRRWADLDSNASQPPSQPATQVDGYVTEDLTMEAASGDQSTATTREELKSVNLMLLAVKGRSDAMSIKKAQELQESAKALRRSLTWQKSPVQQVEVLSKLVDKRKLAAEQAEIDVDTALAAQQTAQVELNEARQALAEAEARVAAAKVICPTAASNALLGSEATQAINNAATLLPADQQMAFQTGINAMLGLFQQMQQLQANFQAMQNGGGANMANMAGPSPSFSGLSPSAPHAVGQSAPVDPATLPIPNGAPLQAMPVSGNLFVYPGATQSTPGGIPQPMSPGVQTFCGVSEAATNAATTFGPAAATPTLRRDPYGGGRRARSTSPVGVRERSRSFHRAESVDSQDSNTFPAPLSPSGQG